MAGRQRIDRVRRQYNQWVANQTLEDYALRFTAKSARRWSAARVANTALGAISFLALEAIGGTITLNYGATNATAAILVVSVIIFCCGLPIAYHAAKCGIDIDLLTRGAGFGYIGSTITSLIYASFTFIFFAIEAVILASALEMCFGIPRPIGYLISAVVIIPLVTYGITLISRFQLWTQPLWIMLHILPFAAIACANPHSFAEWRKFAGEHGDAGGHLDLLLFGTAASVVFSLVAQIGEQVDFLRFLPRDRRTSRTSWWIALLSAGPGWIILGALKLLAGSFLAFFALSHGVSTEHAAEPAHMYLEAFRYVLSQPDLALALTGTFVIVSQLKINVTNAYAGSIAWSNFFSRLTHSHPGRVVWLVFNVHGGAAADGDRRLQGAGADAGALLQRRHRLGRRAGRRSRHQQAARPAPAADRVQARASLRHQSGRRRRHDDRDHRLDQRVLRPVRADREGAVALRRAGGRLRRRAPDRLGHRRQILHRAQAETELAEPRGDPVLHLRAFVRAGGHGLLPGLCRADLLAVLFARRALPRSLQAACADPGAGVGDARQDAAEADLRADQLAARALSRRVRGLRGAGRADARADLSADIGERCTSTICSCRTCCGRCSSR